MRVGSAATPAVDREPRVTKGPGNAPYFGNFVHERAREEDDLVMLGHDRLVLPVRNVIAMLQPRIMDPQLSSPEGLGHAVEVIDESDFPGFELPSPGVVVEAEEIAVAARRDLRVRPR